jgi:hypothetical protein
VGHGIGDHINVPLNHLHSSRFFMPTFADGYVYVPDENGGVMVQAREGVRIAVESRRPPYIVVNDSIKSILVARWPGKLWYA